MNAITFVVDGQPVPQPRPRFTRQGRAYTKDNGIVAYRQAVELASRVAGVQRMSGYLEIDIESVFGRPPSHLNSKGLPTARAPAYPPVADWDNIAKGVQDAIWKQDSCVCGGSCRKRYATEGERPHTTITVKCARHTGIGVPEDPRNVDRRRQSD